MFLLSTLLGAAVADLSCGCTTYTVVSGDSIYGTIAPATGFNWLDICNCNGGNPSCGILTVGDEIQLPCGDEIPPPEPEPVPTPDPTPSPTPNPTVAESSESESSESSSESSSEEDQDLPELTGFVQRDLYSEFTTGDGTYYWDMSEKCMTREKVQALGHCAYSGVGSLPAFGNFCGEAPGLEGCDVMPIAVGVHSSFDGSLACGMCIEYQGTGTGLGNDPISTDWQKGIIVDSGPMAEGSIDLAGFGDGEWGVQWRAVDCETGSSKFEYVFTGSNSWYARMQIRNHKVPVAKVEMLDFHNNPQSWQSYSNEWVEMTRTTDNHFMANMAEMQGPFNDKMRFRITSIFGEVVEDVVDSGDIGNLSSMDFNNPTTGTAQFENGSYGATTDRRRVLSAAQKMQHRLGAMFENL